MVWNWDKDDIRGRERDRDYLRKRYTIIINV